MRLRGLRDQFDLFHRRVCRNWFVRQPAVKPVDLTGDLVRNR